ncbi:hypothetical protein AWB71_01334 [Caballeronia peredens]|nr:hypothetical protein AWB71_01334 [Caballeronia peredens]
MHPTELLYKLKKLDPDTPVSAAHVISLVEALIPLLDKQPTAQTRKHDAWEDLQLIDEQRLSELLGESVETLRKWRKIDKGPKAIKNPKSVRYCLADVREYIDAHRVQNTLQGKKVNQMRRFASGYSVTPLIIFGTKEVEFFESLELQDDPTGYKLIFSLDGFSLSEDTLAKLDDILGDRV